MPTIHYFDSSDLLTDSHERLAIAAFNSAGTRIPMLFVRSWYGELGAYQNLAKALGSDQPVYTIAPPQGHSKSEYPQDVTKWARWIQASAKPLRGDFILGGNSFGGVLALHLTKELAANDLRPLHIALIDTSLPRQSHFEPRSRAHWFVHHLNRLLELPADERADYVRARLADRRTRRAREGAPKVQKDKQATSVITSTGQKMPLLQRAIWVSYLKYQPCVWDLPVSLFWTEESHVRSGDALLGWSPWLRGPIHAYPIAGDHFTIMEPNNVETLALGLRSLEHSVRLSARPRHSALPREPVGASG